MKEKGHYWKSHEDKSNSVDLNFTFESFLQAMHLIATFGFEKLKDDLGVRMNMLYKHIFETMNSNNLILKPQAKQKLGIVDSRNKSKRIVKDGSDVLIMSNRSGASTKSSRAKKHSSNSRKSKKRRSSQRKRGRRYTNDRYTPGSVNLSLLNKMGINDSKNSLPALSAIYGGTFESNKAYGKRNNSGLASIELSNTHKKNKMSSFDKVNQTLDVKMYEKNNSFSLVPASKFTKDLNDTSGKKSPYYSKRNMSFTNNKTIDDRASGEFSTINPLDFDARMSLLKQSNMAKYEGLRNHRNKLHALIQQKRRSGSRKKSSNSKKRAQKKITNHYKNRFNIDQTFQNRHNERKKQLSLKPKLDKKLVGVSSAKNYSDASQSFVINNNGITNDSFQHKYAHEDEEDEDDRIIELNKEQEEIISNNPEDCKDTIFSGEGEILGTAGETLSQPKEEYLGKGDKNDEMIKQLQKENKMLKSHLKKILKAFVKFKHNHSIAIEKASIKIKDNE